METTNVSNTESVEHVDVDVDNDNNGGIALLGALQPLPTEIASQSNYFSVLSFNTLYKDWVMEEDYPYITDDTLRLWSYRLPRLRNMIASYNSDIICLQEIDKNSFVDDFGAYFQIPNQTETETVSAVDTELDEQELHSSETNTKCKYDFLVNKSKKNKIGMANAVLWNAHKFECIYSDMRSRAMIVLLNSKNITNRAPSNSSNNCNQSHAELEGYLVCVINVHLEGQPSKSQVRLTQMQSVLQKRLKLMLSKHHITEENKHLLNIVICGDFNSNFDEIVHRTLLLSSSNKDTDTDANTNTNTNTDDRISHKNKAVKKQQQPQAQQPRPHGYHFKDAYSQFIQQGHDERDIQTQSKCEDNMIDVDTEYESQMRESECYINRVRNFPTFAVQKIICAVDYIYYTENNLKVRFVCQTLPAKELHLVQHILDARILSFLKRQQLQQPQQAHNVNACDNDVDANDANSNTNANKLDLRNVLLLPNATLVSDHLPICSVFEVNRDICNLLNKHRNEQEMNARAIINDKRSKHKQKQHKKNRNANKKKKSGKHKSKTRTRILFHAVSSF